MGNFLTKAEILGVQDIKVEPVEVPAWNATVYVRVLPSAIRDAFEAKTFSDDKRPKEVSMRNFRARLVALCLCDQEGIPLFNDAKDAELLGAKSSLAISTIFDKCAELNGITEKKQEELIKNSENTQSEDSDSVSA